MKIRSIFLITLFLATLFITGRANAADYYFQNPTRTVDVFWNEDGTETLLYEFTFQNDPSGHVIEFVDLSLPNDSFEVSNISAWVNSQPITYISRDEYLGTGSGVALGLGEYSILPGMAGKVTARVERIQNVLYEDDDDDTYASAVFGPAYFDSATVYGVTDLTVIFHLPPGVQPEEPRWHSTPAGFNDPPQTGFDNQGRIIYRWQNPAASPDKLYNFGASFPKTYVPLDSINPNDPLPSWVTSINLENLLPFGCIGIFILIGVLSVASDRNRRMQYVPPRIMIEGNGIKRGLTAIEAAILLEQPLDKILTMILFSVIKKNAARVAKRDPLTLEIAKPEPEGLYPYEVEFLEAFRAPGKERTIKLQDVIINLVKATTNKIRGFSGRETRSYYRSIIQKAWQQVEEADTPEIRSQKFDDVMEWTMLDKNYEDRTRDIFRSQPVFIPRWWAGFDPVYRSTAGKRVVSSPVASAGGSRNVLPTLPGADFAASIVNGVQSFSSGVIGNLSNFTSSITQKTNPVPVTRSSGSSSGRSGGGGCACACACACAGCACACAGGGR
jgi:hypothetical protein